VREIVRQTVRAGWQGRVAVGHLTELAALPAAEQAVLIAELAAARIGVISLPLTDLYLMGRRDERNVRRGLTPIRRLLEAGVPVALASNNIRNPFTPIGTADPAHLAFVGAVAAHMGTTDLMGVRAARGHRDGPAPTAPRGEGRARQRRARAPDDPALAHEKRVGPLVGLTRAKLAM
jgi:cytosine/adenosine deaminase-related metal-dependent hydrolase